MKNLKLFFTSALTLLLLTLLFISCGKSTTDANGCYYDIDVAVEAANKKNQDIMVIFTLDEDDEDSTDFLNKVVRDPGFKKEIASKYAVVVMDFSSKTYQAAVAPEDASDAVKKAADEKAEIMKKNAKYGTMLEVSQIPVIYIFSKELYLIKGLFYDDQNRTLQGFKDALAEKSSVIDDMHKMIYQTKIGTAEEKVAAIDKLYESTSPSFRIFLYDLMDSVSKLDPSDKSGLVGKYKYEAASAKSDRALLEGDTRGAVQAFIDAADDPMIPAEDRQQALYTAAYMSSKAGLDDVSVVIGYLEKSIAIAPDSDQVPALRRVIAALSSQ